MSCADDYQINRRLAEIAGAHLVPGTHELLVYRYGDDYPEHTTEWSPLTDWSQLGPLLDGNHDIALHTDGGLTQVECWPSATQAGGATDGDMKRAICLAIIAAHDDE
jgi:hypothetical protein